MKAALIPALLSACFAGFPPAPSRAESVIAQWERIHDEPGNRAAYPSDLAVDNAGNVIVTGSTSEYNGLRGVSYTAKHLAASGTLLWEKRFPPNPEISGTGAGPAGVAVDLAGNVIVAGTHFNSSTYKGDFYTVKYAGTTGALLWEKYFNAPGNQDDTCTAMTLDGAGNVIVTGYTTNIEGIGGNYDYYTAKYASANGALLWERRYDGPGPGASRDQARHVATDTGGNVFVTGVSDSSVRGGYTAKYAAADGAIVWEQRFPGPDPSSAFRVVVDGEGNAIVTGSSNTEDPYTVKYAAADGAVLWEKRLTEPGGYSQNHSLAVDSEGNVTVSGGFYRNGSYYAAFVAKYAAADGSLLWENRSVTPGLLYGAIVLDEAGNAIVTGTAGTGNNGDIYTAMFAAADGELLWEKRYNGTRNLTDGGSALAVNHTGSIYVGGYSNWDHNNPDGFGGYDAYVVRYVSVDIDDDGLLDSWEVSHFGDTAAHSALDDTDGDGAVELLELAFGTDPRAPHSVPAPAVVIEGGYLTTTITKQPCVRYLVETGATLENGFSAASTTVLTDTATTLKVRDNIPVGTQSTRFLRVKVTGAP